MKLYSYFRSSAAYRVRIALNLKGLPYETVPVHLLRQGGEQLLPEYRRLNPTALVPTLVDGDLALGQSMAILEYLEETYPQPALLPADAAGRARVRAIAQTIACDIHPLDNLRVLKYLKHEMKVSEESKNAWYRHWVEVGLAAVEGMLAQHPATGEFCHGGQPSFADLCLVPQVANARRFECDLGAMPTIVRIDARCQELDAFRQAAPAKQPDAE
ncbi:maleylacetoacetate isomerase [Candidimonas nitroreducens]|uniref:Maleylacetoacetate isomerase n=1 Tax=Candidimonas nitroreducens TaxID=683354 RepID=A0A225M9L9_9BURK|nr:maleylacetoacetate isomerase [Candidimonas nitroreducens]OWT57432.1 maleylacetoacetate isomerase [Candidimonas nitroreducens]